MKSTKNGLSCFTTYFLVVTSRERKINRKAKKEKERGKETKGRESFSFLVFFWERMD